MRRFVFENRICTTILAITFGLGSIILVYNQMYVEVIPLFVLFSLFVAGLLYKPDSLIKIEVYNNAISFFFRENKKSCIKTFNFHDIKDFKFNISLILDYNTSNRGKSADLIFHIIDKNDNSYSFEANAGFIPISKFFDALRFVPNFKYNVNTNSDTFAASINTYARQGKDISIFEKFKITLKDPKIPIILRIRIVFLLLALIVMTPIIITDIIKYY